MNKSAKISAALTLSNQYQRILVQRLVDRLADLVDDPDQLFRDVAEPGALREEGNHHHERTREGLLDPVRRGRHPPGRDRRWPVRHRCPAGQHADPVGTH